jgi:hypothetical protein
VFAHVDGRWLTPASGTLAGITRQSLIELAAEAGDQVQQGRLSASDLRRATEVLITSTAGGIMPVTLVDGQPVGTGSPGPRTTSLHERYWARHQDPRFSSPVRYDGPRLRAPPEHRNPRLSPSAMNSATDNARRAADMRDRPPGDSPSG